MRSLSALIPIAALLLAAAILSPAASAQAAPAQPSSEATVDPHLAKAIDLRGQAMAAYDQGDYDRAAELARQAKAELGLIASPALPAEYTVRLIPADRDSLSKIAGYPFVYGDRNKWPFIYRANRKTLKHPENADIILPGERLVIPSIAGEERKDEWSPEGRYPEFMQK